MGREVHVFEDYRELLAADVVDAVVISTPNFTHARILEDIFQYPELHVLVEKPLCTDLSDCRAVEERASAHRGVGLGRDGIPLYAAGRRDGERTAFGKVGPTTAPSDPRVPFSVFTQGRRLEPL